MKLCFQFMRVTCYRNTSNLRAHDPYMPFVSLLAWNAGSSKSKEDAITTCYPPSDRLAMPSDWLAGSLRPGHDRPEFSRVIAVGHDKTDRRLIQHFHDFATELAPRPCEYGCEQCGVVSVKPAWGLLRGTLRLLYVMQGVIGKKMQTWRFLTMITFVISCWLDSYSLTVNASLPERTRGRPWGRLRVHIHFIKKWSWEFYPAVPNFTNARCFGIRTHLKQYHCYESATIRYPGRQYLSQFNEIINNLQEMPFVFCHYAVRSCGTWRKGPGQSPRNVLSISNFWPWRNQNELGCFWPRHR